MESKLTDIFNKCIYTHSKYKIVSMIASVEFAMKIRLHTLNRFFFIDSPDWHYFSIFETSVLEIHETLESKVLSYTFKN